MERLVSNAAKFSPQHIIFLISNKTYYNSSLPLSRETQGPLLSLVCFINNEPYNWISVYFQAEVQAIFPLVFPRGYFLESIFLMCGLNSFQQLAISIPFSRFMSMCGIIVTPGLRQSIKSASLIFLFLQCGSKSKKTLFFQSIVCFLFLRMCCAIPLVFCLHLIAYSCCYLREGKNC